MSSEAPLGVWGGMICDLLLMIYDLSYAISCVLLLTCVSQAVKFTTDCFVLRTRNDALMEVLAHLLRPGNDMMLIRTSLRGTKQSVQCSGSADQEMTKTRFTTDCFVLRPRNDALMEVLAHLLRPGNDMMLIRTSLRGTKQSVECSGSADQEMTKTKFTTDCFVVPPRNDALLFTTDCFVLRPRNDALMEVLAMTLCCSERHCGPPAGEDFEAL